MKGQTSIWSRVDRCTKSIPLNPSPWLNPDVGQMHVCAHPHTNMPGCVCVFVCGEVRISLYACRHFYHVTAAYLSHTISLSLPICTSILTHNCLSIFGIVWLGARCADCVWLQQRPVEWGSSRVTEGKGVLICPPVGCNQAPCSARR